MRPEEIEDKLGFPTEPAALIVKTPFSGDAGAAGCWIGGLPTLPERTEWPMRMDRGRPLHPLHFIAQINLAELPGGAARYGLPELGTLFFFDNYVHDTAGQSAVIHVEEDISGLKARPIPEFPEGFERFGSLRHWEKNPVTSFDRWPVQFHAYDALDTDITPWSDKLTQATLAEQRALRSVASGQGMTRNKIIDWLKGANKGAPRREASLHRLMGPDNRHARSRPAQSEYLRLLTLEHDPDIRFEFNCEELVFLIHRDDLTQGRFDRAIAHSVQ
ncbi:MAG: DUF1963 domain-containing protein [Rhodobacteraceae bacterium]|nr:DUF1963 domain-containing protein [Paracoccaceae bacterium]